MDRDTVLRRAISMASIFLSGFADLTFHSTSGPSCDMEPEIGNWNGQYRLTKRASTDLNDESEDAQAAFFYLALLRVSPFDIIIQRQGRRFWTVPRGSGAFIIIIIFFLREDTCPPSHINVTNNWSEEKEVRTGVGKD